MMIPLWLTILAWSVTGIGLLCALIILADIYLGGYRQPMTSWEAVWPITAIYAGPLALVAYYRWGRPATARWQNRHGAAPDQGLAVMAALETIPGGAASFIGHLIAVPIVVGTGITIAGKGVWPMILLIAAFALPLLIAFEYRSLTRMGQIRSAGLRLRVALKISALAIIAFDIGMGVTMLIVAFVLGYPPTTIAFWFVMWGGLLLGFMTAYPMVRWLLGRGVTTPAESV
ncbi:DUF4396 domain-containing protein [Marinobacter salarius]|nr:MAG: hypothetical protein AXW11_06625 [Marinobacter sp. Hex_13]MBL82282.1 DUF4396 domain-containing protein [Marinobacter sp.]MBS8229377.1 DUF4396 domain-containing protein [Marinobacter salarius]OLF85321.1 hypothetical protein AWH63_13790 [Marinobacter sp. C18]RUT74247.1 DUF4396 domain-containing protein [Marinobacter sp. NP-6]HCS26309.1 DUF4396 domain-containing protein [Spongiibacteraceae bacterium]